MNSLPLLVSIAKSPELFAGRPLSPGHGHPSRKWSRNIDFHKPIHQHPNTTETSKICKFIFLTRPSCKMAVPAPSRQSIWLAPEQFHTARRTSWPETAVGTSPGSLDRRERSRRPTAVAVTPRAIVTGPLVCQ